MSSELVDEPAAAPSTNGSGPVPSRRAARRGGTTTDRSAKQTTHRWVRWIHVYTSMISLVLVLFFGITGITLNHPDWTFGSEATTTTKTGTLASSLLADGQVDELGISEFLRTTYGISAPLADHQLDGDQGLLSYRDPGYAANVTYDTTSGDYRLTVEQQGLVGVMNDLHKGRDASGSWKWVIDVIAGFLVVISLTGLVLQLFLKRRRRSALAVAAGGIAVTALLVVLAF